MTWQMNIYNKFKIEAVFVVRFKRTFVHVRIQMPHHASMHALSNKTNNDRSDGHSHSFAWILTILDVW